MARPGGQTRPSRIAVIGAGYKDGVPRALSSARLQRHRRMPSLPAAAARSSGRVSMDMMALDVTDLPRDSVARGTKAELIGPNIAIDEAAEWAGTISYELLTRLGQRYARLYSGLESTISGHRSQ